ncbi:RNA-binding domain-containing protein [Basidiobolus meristosporus CBS 931.73]|uniref:RNA-binding domain-containing protein n=1 Tax=Basidiobolus meristosporus CBS 931.73 TaxID=1314790 RepID=A0A1Y1WWC0_9FUNG|nr:RNA-binding domain-containing protein [Basidiobolus meristosporus CBS 931.73]|eukprot:ORX77608.1 RNA-binding domain-containing protein [Basidiobolus meristosporus CBS 931.73]
MSRKTLFVVGFGSSLRARDLAYEFERYGRLIRCDIPAPKSHSSRLFAFVEFEDSRDAEDAYVEMHGRSLDGHALSVQWAKNAPPKGWRGGRSRSPRLSSHSHSRDRSWSPQGSRGRRSYSRSRSPTHEHAIGNKRRPGSRKPHSRSPPPIRSPVRIRSPDSEKSDSNGHQRPRSTSPIDSPSKAMSEPQD